jgi:hypothetical protein
MKFKMGSQSSGKSGDDSLHDSTATSSNPAASRPSSNSGLFDVSRMTNLRTPTDPYGQNAAQVTKQRGRELDLREQRRTETLRALLLAIAVPLIAGAGYLVYSGKRLNLSGNVLPTQALVAPEDPSDRSPATSATLPIAKIDVEPAANKQLGLTQILLNQASKSEPSVESNGKRPVKFVLDENGKLLSPFSVELDEDGNEVARLEFQDHLAFLPPISYGAFEKISSFSQSKPSEEFMKLLADARPRFQSAFRYTQAEVLRFNYLRNSVPEVNFLNIAYSRVARELTGRRPFAVRSLSPQSNSPEYLKQAEAELDWLEPTVTFSQITGDRSFDERLKASVLEWSRTYVASGNPDEDIRLDKIAMAYEYLQENLKPEENSVVRSFLMKLADTQMVRFKSHKVYDRAHAQHVHFMLSLGGALRDPRILEHAVYQYRNHIDRAPMFLFESFDYENLISLRYLLDSTIILERLGFRFYQKQVAPRSLAHGIEILRQSSETEHPWDYLLASVSAGYFEPTMFEKVRRLTGSPDNRYATTYGITLAALRKEFSSLKPVNERIPSSVQKATNGKAPPRSPNKRSRQ